MIDLTDQKNSEEGTLEDWFPSEKDESVDPHKCQKSQDSLKEKALWKIPMHQDPEEPFSLQTRRTAQSERQMTSRYCQPRQNSPSQKKMNPTST